ncbi:MAG: hypothetical protein HDR04_06795 [Lachnospiraceae bacterium]|nr:hypothetical protein [Lachnospiraceae bacterium]
MNKLQLNSKKIIIWLCVNYGMFILAFFVLGTLGSEYKAILWINLCIHYAGVRLAVSVVFLIAAE